jgi:hypothetical protein
MYVYTYISVADPLFAEPGSNEAEIAADQL